MAQDLDQMGEDERFFGLCQLIYEATGSRVAGDFDDDEGFSDDFYVTLGAVNVRGKLTYPLQGEIFRKNFSSFLSAFIDVCHQQQFFLDPDYKAEKILTFIEELMKFRSAHIGHTATFACKSTTGFPSCVHMFVFMLLAFFPMYRISFVIKMLTHYRPATPETEKNILEDLFSSVLSQFKKYHTGNMKFNNLDIFQSLKLRI